LDHRLKRCYCCYFGP